MIVDFDPVAFSIFQFDVRWYSLAYIFGIAFGYWYMRLLGGVQKLNEAFFENFFEFLALGIVIGGRLFYVLFYNPKFYLENPGEILSIWRGGMSFHGGAIGALVSLYILCRRTNVDLLTAADLLTCSAPVGVALGRIANFINGELYGKRTDSIFGMIFPLGGLQLRHPSQLYEAAIEGVLLFICLNFFYIKIVGKYNLRSGVTFWLGVALYSIFRFILEFFREPDEQLGYILFGLTMGQILTLFFFALGTFFTLAQLKKGLENEILLTYSPLINQGDSSINKTS